MPREEPSKRIELDPMQLRPLELGFSFRVHTKKRESRNETWNEPGAAEIAKALLHASCAEDLW
jgi:hypothetical protein